MRILEYILWQLKNYAHYIIELFIPRLCLACGSALLRIEEQICLFCQADLPETDFHLSPNNNPFSERVTRFMPVVAGASLYWFTRRSRVQRIIHHIKYRNRPDAAIALGRFYGYKLSRAPPFSEADCLIYVPMHARKQRKRGYNQAEKFAQGMSESMAIPLITNALYKIKMTVSQTQMSKVKRLQNVEGVFELKQPIKLHGKKIILADDVMTTGATLESCCRAIWNELPDAPILLVTIAYAKR